MPKDEIEALKQKFVEQLSPMGIYLFGSFAEGRNTEGSDFDFYIIVDDSVKDIPDLESAIKAPCQSRIRSSNSRSERRQHDRSVPSGSIW